MTDKDGNYRYNIRVYGDGGMCKYIPPIPKNAIFLNMKAAIQRLEKIARTKTRPDFTLLGPEGLLASQTSFASYSSHHSVQFRVARIESVEDRQQVSKVIEGRQDRYDIFINAIKTECFESLDLCVKKKSCEMDSPDLGEQELQMLQKQKPNELLMSCLLGQRQSLLVEKYIKKLIREEDPTVGDLVEAFSQNLRFFVRNERASYITSALIKVSDQAARHLAEHCLHNISKLLKNKVAVKILQALAGVSVQFSNYFVNFYRQNFLRLKDSKTAGLLVNKALLKTDDRSSIEQLVEKTRREVLLNPWGVKELLRPLSSILNRCELESSEGLLLAIIPHINWFLDDKIGNYSVQELLQPKFAAHSRAIHRGLLSNPSFLMFTEKHRKPVLLAATEHPSNEKLLTNLVLDLCADIQNFKKVISSRCSSNILLITLASIGSPEVHNRVFEAALFLNSSGPTARGGMISEEPGSIEWFVGMMNEFLKLKEKHRE